MQTRLLKNNEQGYAHLYQVLSIEHACTGLAPTTDGRLNEAHYVSVESFLYSAVGVALFFPL